MNKENSHYADMEDRESHRARLLWRCRRGMLELDILLQGFIVKYYGTLAENEQTALNTLLEYPDAVLFDLLMGKSVTTDREIGRVIKKIRTAASS